MMSNVPAERGEEDESDATRSSAPGDDTEVRMLLCDICQSPIVEESEFIRMRQSSASADLVYCYDLDLFSDDQPVCAYSAKNPSEYRFDLVCVQPTSPICEQGTEPLHGSRSTLMFAGNFSSDSTFFEGYAWRCVTCICCKRFLGWGFRRIREEPPPSAGIHAIRELNSSTNESAVSFVAIVVTHCTWKKGPRSSFLPVIPLSAALLGNHQDAESTESELPDDDELYHSDIEVASEEDEDLDIL